MNTRVVHFLSGLFYSNLSRFTFISRYILILLIVSFTAATAFSQQHGGLRVAENNRYLEYEDGTPFFYLGDTAWELFHRLNREEADRYLTDRAEKGFTVVQAVILEDAGAGFPLPGIGKE